MFDRKLREEVRGLKAEIKELREAYNELFDVVAEDLGYQSRKSLHPYALTFVTFDPRRIDYSVTPEQRSVIRNPTARCASPQKGRKKP